MGGVQSPIAAAALQRVNTGRRGGGPSDAGERRRLVIMEWLLGEGNVGLALTFYAARNEQEALRLCERLDALELPDGAVERSLTVQPIQRYPTTDAEFEENLENQRVFAAAVLAGNAAAAAEGDRVTDGSPIAAERG